MTPEGLRVAIIRDVLTGRFTESKHEKELKGIDEEYFEIYKIPITWDVVTLQECCYLHARIGWQALRKSEHQRSGDYLLITGTDFKNGFVDYSTCAYVSKERYDMDEKIQLKNDDILVTKDGSIGKVAVVKNLPKPATLNAGVFVVRPDDRFEKRYIEYLFQCSYFSRFVNLVKSGSTIKHLNQNKLLKFKIPVPSKKEQIEIISVLDKWLPRVDELENLDKKLNTLNTNFPYQMKKSILQQAVMGKLVPQDPNDEPARVLLEKIAGEKNRLIKEGKIKKQKKLPEITEDEIPFDIPENWMWTRMGDIVCLENGDRSSKYPKTSDYVESGVPFFGAKDMIEGILSFDNTRFITQKKYDELGNGKLQNGDLVCLLRGSVGKTVEFCANDLYKTGFICAQMVIIRLYDLCLLPYAKIVLESPYYKSALEAKITGTAVKQLPASEIFNMLIPIPPINEQCRICDRVKELMKIMESLRSRQ